jgi:hypothetical protein
VARLIPAGSPQDAAGRSSSPIFSHTRACLAPVPSPKIVAILGSTSSKEYVPAMRSENSESTSYGVARFPYTIRLANRLARSRTGLKARAITAAAASVRNGLRVEPMAVPIPTTIATYTAVKNAASTPYTTVLLTTTSRSYRPCLRIAMPQLTGTATPKPSRRSRSHHPFERLELIEVTMITVTKPMTMAAVAYASHLSCWRSSPVERRVRRTVPTMEATRMAIAGSQMIPMAPLSIDPSTATPIGFLMVGEPVRVNVV